MRRNMGRLLVVLSVVLFALAIGTRTGFAEQIALESYVGNRPGDADRIAPLIRSVFDRRGFTVDPPTLRMLFREHVFRPGLVAPKFGDTLKKLSSAAENDFSDEKYAKVASDLSKLIEAMRQNPLILARDPKYRELAMRVLVYYALADGRQAQALASAGKPDEATRAERIRDEP